MSGLTCLLDTNVCLLLLLQQSRILNNILQNNLKGTAESRPWQTQAQQATADGQTDLNATLLSDTNTM